MEIEKSPAFQFYPKDFMSDGKVLMMSPEVRGLYIWLLCIDWIEDGFPVECMGKLSGFEWIDEGMNIRTEDYDSAMAQLSECFVQHPRKEGYLTNPRLERERVKQLERRAERAASGKKGAKKRWEEKEVEATQAHTPDSSANGIAIIQPMAKHGFSSSSSSSSSSSNKNNIPVLSNGTPSKPTKPKPTFNPEGKTKYLDWVYLSPDQYKRVVTYYEEKGLDYNDFKEAVRELDRWFGDNPKKRLKRTDDAKALMGWPLDRALQRRRELLNTQAAERRLKEVAQ